jgi:hypothetical protein
VRVRVIVAVPVIVRVIMRGVVMMTVSVFVRVVVVVGMIAVGHGRALAVGGCVGLVNGSVRERKNVSGGNERQNNRFCGVLAGDKGSRDSDAAFGE